MIERRGLLAGVASLAVLLPGGAPAEATSNKYNHIPEVDAKAIGYNAAYLKAIGCSAWLLRDVKGEVDGLVTADHCLKFETRMEGSDGQSYIVQPETVVAEIGRTVGSQQTVAQIDKWILPGTLTAPDKGHDMVIGIAQGHTPAEAETDLQRIKLPARKFHHDDKLYSGAFPIPQPQNNSGRLRLQMFNLTLERHGITSFDNFKLNISTLLFNMPATPDGATCSPGSSGAGAVKMVHGVPRLGGVMSASPLGDIRSYGVSKEEQQLDPFEGSTCAYADDIDLRYSSIFTAVHSLEEIPGYTTMSKSG